MEKSKSKRKAKPAVLPEQFKSLDEAAEFWDAHDSADYEGLMSDVDCEVDIKTETYLVQLDGDLYRKVRAIARKKGVPTESLVNRWVGEKAS